MKSVGLLGGSFDPPHKGHIYISIEAKTIFKLDEVWWLISPQNPLKILKPASYKERIYNCKKITKNVPIAIKEIERNIKSKYTYETLDFLLNHYVNIKFFWLMGADNLINFHKWEKWKQIFKDISIVVFKRHGYNTKALRSIAFKTFANRQIISSLYNKNQFDKVPSWTWIDSKEVRISSTELRQQRELLRRKEN